MPPRSLSYVLTWELSPGTALALPPAVDAAVYGTKIVDSKAVAMAYVRYATRRSLLLLQSCLRAAGFTNAIVYDMGRHKARALAAVRKAVGDTVKEHGVLPPCGRGFGAYDTRPIADFYAMIDPVPSVLCAFAEQVKREEERKRKKSARNAAYYATHGALERLEAQEEDEDGFAAYREWSAKQAPADPAARRSLLPAAALSEPDDDEKASWSPI